MFRRFAARLLGFRVESTPPRRESVDPLWQAQADAFVLLEAIYTGQPWSRRSMAKRMSQPRWSNATQLLRSAEILDQKGRRVSLDYDIATAKIMIHEVVRREREKRRNPRYVSPW
jgi:hypothetical protein